ncbi:hypothetical protein RFI_31811 [Reticulomyxa filosa]|uniref:Uncharacterized protein n=1 Tax=Reticulomyxa filosa TaxID=46433 RepID=X6LXX7_RETFI|nr:hypothetical protein RFI_31811 [Reticulomyxa filosa]|eukprot:ETO05585.1 hypothetical protein RFI_31811 [Reticulomyxa filosa]
MVGWKWTNWITVDKMARAFSQQQTIDCISHYVETDDMVRRESRTTGDASRRKKKITWLLSVMQEIGAVDFSRYMLDDEDYYQDDNSFQTWRKNLVDTIKIGVFVLLEQEMAKLESLVFRKNRFSQDQFAIGIELDEWKHFCKQWQCIARNYSNAKTDTAS